MNPQNFFESLQNDTTSPAKSSYSQRVLSLYKQNQLKGSDYLKQISFSDLKAFEVIFKHIPDLIQLQLANSSTIRYAQLFDLPKTVSVFCNRGTSGIDGSSSTAIGAALMTESPTLLITGDLSFFMTSMPYGMTIGNPILG